MEIKTGHKKDCTWATPLPNEYTNAGTPCYYGCNCGYDNWYIENEIILDEEVLIIDRLEHGNGGICGTKVLDKMSLRDAFSKFPADYGIDRTSKMFGFFPIINKIDSPNNYWYYWDEEDECWVER